MSHPLRVDLLEHNALVVQLGAPIVEFSFADVRHWLSALALPNKPTMALL
jgi:hypothetical protein